MRGAEDGPLPVRPRQAPGRGGPRCSSGRLAAPPGGACDTASGRCGPWGRCPPRDRPGTLGAFIATPRGSVVSCRCLLATGPFPVPSASVVPLPAPLESGGGGFLPSSVDILGGKMVPPHFTSLPQVEESGNGDCAFLMQHLEICLAK